MKATVEIELPDSCDLCPLFCNHYSDMFCKVNKRGIDYPYPSHKRQKWCPLKVKK